MPDAVQGAVEHRQPLLVRQRLGDVRLGVAHQALELLTRRVDVGPVDRVRLPAPAVAVVGQPDGLAAREDGGAPRRHLVEAGRFVPIDDHRPRPPSFPPGPCSRRRRGRCGPAAPRCVGCCSTCGTRSAPATSGWHLVADLHPADARRRGSRTSSSRWTTPPGSLRPSPPVAGGAAPSWNAQIVRLHAPHLAEQGDPGLLRPPLVGRAKRRGSPRAPTATSRPGAGPKPECTAP